MLRRFTISKLSSTSTSLAACCFSYSSFRFQYNSNFGSGTHGTQQTMTKSSKYVNTQTTAAPIRTACGRTFDPMTFQELLQATTDPSWSAAIQRHLFSDTEYLTMLRTEGGGGLAIDELVLKGLGGSDEEAMGKLKQLLQTDRKAALSVCALQDAYVAIRENRDLGQTKAAAGESSLASRAVSDQRVPFGGPASNNNLN